MWFNHLRVTYWYRDELSGQLLAIQCHLGLECRALVPFEASCHLRSLVPTKLPKWEQKIHLTKLFGFAEPPLVR